MSQSYTYDTLKASMQTWRDSDNAEFVAAIDEIIGQAELAILRDLNLTIFDETLGTTIAQHARLVAKPAGTIMTRNLWIDIGTSSVEIFPRTKSWCIDYSPDDAVYGVPEYFYENDDTEWYVTPASDQAYSIEALVCVRPEPMASNVQTTWLGTNVGDLLHAQTLKQALRFQKKFQEIPAAEQEYQTRLQVARLELRSLIRADYSPLRAAAQAI